MDADPSVRLMLLTLIYEQVGLWSTTPEVGQERIVRLACDLLVAGDDGRDVVALAGMSVRGQDYDFAERAEAALRELGLTPPGRHTDAAQAGAVRAVCRAMLDGEITPRALAQWAHQVIGHSGAGEAQRLVDLDDAYDVDHQPIAELDQQVRAEAERLVIAL